MPDNWLPTTPGTQISWEVAARRRGWRSLLRHLLRHRLKGRRGWACPYPWCRPPTLKYLLEDLTGPREYRKGPP